MSEGNKGAKSQKQEEPMTQTVETIEPKEHVLKGVVYVKPIKKYSWLPAGHDGEIRYAGTAEHLAIQVDTSSRTLNTGLSPEDEERLEKALLLTKGTLSKYNKEYWGDFRRTIAMKREGIALNLSNPQDEIIYKNLLAHTKVANSESEMYENPEYEYYMSTPELEARIKNTKGKAKRECYKLFNKMSTSEFRDVLKYTGKAVDESASIDLIEQSVNEIIEADPNEFLAIVKDPDFKIKVFIKDCVSIRALIVRGSRYLINGGDSIGTTLTQAIEYLSDPVNNDIYLDLKAKLEASKK
jgi:hypothetical protein